MNRTLNVLLVTAVIALAGVTAAIVLVPHQKPESAAPAAHKQMYHCPMHPSYISDKPGKCPICGMDLVPINAGQHEQSADAKSMKGKILYYRDAMNPGITSDKPGKAADGMDLVPVYEGEGGDGSSGIRIDPIMVQDMGVTTAPVEMKNLRKEIRASAILENNEPGVYLVNTKFMGYVEKLFVDFTGQSVRKGQPLLTIYSPDLVTTQEEYLQALQYAKGFPGGSSTAADGARSLVESAKRRLLNWDISPAQIETLAQRGIPGKTMTLYAPSSGIVMEKKVVAGQSIEAGSPLYTIADLSRIWAMANVYQEDLPYVKNGMSADVELSSIPGRTFRGNVRFISRVLDPNSKTAQVRIEIPNTPDYALKPQMFASVKILSPIAGKGIAIPEQAVIHTGARNIVIVALGNGYFKPQEVTLGATAQGYVRVLDGLKVGQTVVTSSQFLIDSESNLRAAVSKMAVPVAAPGQNTPEQENKDGAHKPVS